MDIRSIPATAFTDPSTIRLISTAYINEPALAPLADSETDLKFLEQLEAATSPRHDRRMPLPSGVDRSELMTERYGYGWSYINAAFCYTRPTGNRFNDATRGAWYAATGEQAAQTAQSEIAYHLGRELEATGVFENVTVYRELLSGFTTTLYDLRSNQAIDALNPDQSIGYPAGQALAADIFTKGGNGLLYPSVRRPTGICLVAFRPALIQNIRQGQTWTFTWEGSIQQSIEKG